MMPRYLLTHQLNEAICAKWGLDPAYVRRITISWSPEELPRADVELFLSESVIHELLTLAVVARDVSPNEGSRA